MGAAFLHVTGGVPVQPQTPVPTGEVRGAYKNANLLEALDKYRNVKPRTPEWLLNFIDKVYKVKFWAW